MGEQFLVKQALLKLYFTLLLLFLVSCDLLQLKVSSVTWIKEHVTDDIPWFIGFIVDYFNFFFTLHHAFYAFILNRVHYNRTCTPCCTKRTADGSTPYHTFPWQWQHFMWQPTLSPHTQAFHSPIFFLDYHHEECEPGMYISTDSCHTKNRQTSKECHIIGYGHWPSEATLNFRNYEMEKNENFVEGDMDLIWCNHSRVGWSIVPF